MAVSVSENADTPISRHFGGETIGWSAPKTPNDPFPLSVVGATLRYPVSDGMLFWM